MVELYSSFFCMLRLAKKLYESGFADKLPDSFQTLTLDEDLYYNLSYEAADVIFEGTSFYYNENSGVNVYVFRDPLIDRFCQLCWQYEQRSHLTEEENPYRKEIEQIIRSGFCLNGYDYDFDWKLSASDRGRCRLLFFYGDELCYLDELPEGLLEIREGFQALNCQMEKALSDMSEEKATEREAA